MLDERSKYFEYLDKKTRVPESLLRGYLRRSVIFVAVAGFLSALLVIELRAVMDSWFGIPQPIQEYMLNYGIRRFSYHAFRALCQSYGLTQHKMLLLVSVYYSYWALWPLIPALTLSFFANELRINLKELSTYRKRRSHDANRRAFWHVMSLHGCLDELSYQPRRSEKRRAEGLIKSLDPYRIVSPLREGWQADPARRWFQGNPLSKRTIRTLAALKSFRNKALYCVRNDHNVARLADAVNELATFLYVASLDEETEFRSPKPIPEAEQAIIALVAFADTLNRIDVKRDVEPGLTRRLVDGISTISASRSVRLIFAIAVTAAIVMGLGSLLFKVPASTAFLTWVSIVFGSAILGIALKIPDSYKAPY